MIRLLALLPLFASVACTPVVTHGPRVEPGVHVTGTFGVARNLCDSVCALDGVPQIGIGARYGRAPEAGRVGYSVGGTLAFGVVSSEADAYVQLPTAPSWAAGAGVLLSPSHVMPYVQAGRMREDGSGFYTTQGFALMAPRPREWNIEEEVEVAPRYWAPTLAYRAPHRGAAVHVYLSGALGWMEVDDPGVSGDARRQPVRVLMAGFSFEQRIRGSVQPVQTPRLSQAP